MERIDSPEMLGKAIRAERKRRGLTQGELAAHCGVGINFVSDVERGKATAEVGKTLRLLNMLGLVTTVERRGEWNRISRFIGWDEQHRSLSGSSDAQPATSATIPPT